LTRTQRTLYKTHNHVKVKSQLGNEYLVCPWRIYRIKDGYIIASICFVPEEDDDLPDDDLVLSKILILKGAEWYMLKRATKIRVYKPIPWKQFIYGPLNLG